MGFLNTFRGRLLLILLIMLVATIGVQYYLNLRTQQDSLNLRQIQSQALVAGIAVGFNSLTSSKEEDRVADLIDRAGQSFIDPSTRSQIIDVIIIDNEWRVRDSVRDDYQPTVNDNNEAVYKNLSDLKDLPPLMEGSRLGDDLKYFPNARTEQNKKRDDEAHAIPIETSKGRWYVMVLLRNDKSETARRAAQPLIYMLAVLLISTLITFLLGWRFTRPIANLSNAARQVAEGNLQVRVADAERNDEMGQLAQN